MVRNALVVAAVALAVGTASMSNPRSGLAAAVSIPLVLDDTGCDLQCMTGGAIDCPHGWHDAWEVSSYPSAQRGQGAHNGQRCFSGTCDEKHPACGEGGGDTFARVDHEGLRLSLATNNHRGASEVIAQHPKFLTVNVARSAVQVRNCVGDVVAHFPLESSAIARLDRQVARFATRAGTELGEQPD